MSILLLVAEHIVWPIVVYVRGIIAANLDGLDQVYKPIVCGFGPIDEAASPVDSAIGEGSVAGAPDAELETHGGGGVVVEAVILVESVFAVEGADGDVVDEPTEAVG